jgi:hypothetical protein
LDNIAWLNAAFGTSGFVSGSVSGGVHAVLSPGEAFQARASIDAERATVRLGSRRIRVTGSAAAPDITFDFSRERGEVKRLLVHLRSVTLPSKKKDVRWWAIASAKEFTWEGLPPSRFRARFDVDAMTAEPLMPLLVENGVLRGAALALLEFDDTKATVELLRTPTALEVRIPKAQSGDLQAQGAFRSRRGKVCGSFLLDALGFTVGIDLRPGDTDVRPFRSSGSMLENLREACGS